MNVDAYLNEKYVAGYFNPYNTGDVVISQDSDGYSSATITLTGDQINSLHVDEKKFTPSAKSHYYGSLKMTTSQVRDKTVFSGYRDFFTIKRVIFNDPATIVFWEDETKTVVKCSDDDIFNPEVGIAMCIAKKLYGDDKYHGVFRRAMKKAEWIKKGETK